MTAIGGVARFDGAPVDTGALSRLADALDQEPRTGLWTEGGLGFAQRSDGGSSAPSQALFPARTADGLLVLIADARIDNRQELIDGLRGREQALPPAPPDAALLLGAWICWGDEYARRVRGAWAAALWDGGRQQLTLLRDPLGERALYWHRAAGAVWFATEPVHLLRTGEVPEEVHPERILAYLLGVAPEPTWSFFRHVSRLPEGHLLTFSHSETLLRRTWDWHAIQPEPRAREEAARLLAERLRAAVTRRLARQGDNGVLLSGGLDSLSVASAAASALEAQERKLHLFTWASQNGDPLDERAASNLFVRSRGNLAEHPVLADNLWPLSRYPEAYADPNEPGSQSYPDLLLTTLETARQIGVTLLMNGIGGDPVVGWQAPDLALLLGGSLKILARRWRQSGLRRSGILGQLSAGLPRRRRLPGWLTPAAREQARDAGLDRQPLAWRDVASRRALRMAALRSPWNAAHLERFDRLGRRTGVRIVAPWHDLDLACAVLSLPDGAVDTAGPGKSLLREAMAGCLPDPLRLAARKNLGEANLWRNGLLRRGKGCIEGLLRSSRLGELGLLDAPQFLSTYHAAADQGEVTPRLWEVVTAECWLRAAPLNRLDPL